MSKRPIKIANVLLSYLAKLYMNTSISGPQLDWEGGRESEDGR